VSVLSLSLKFSVPLRRCRAPESVVLEFSVKPTLAEDDVNVGV